MGIDLRRLKTVKRRMRATPRERQGLDPLEHTEAVRLMDVVKLHENLHPELKMLAHVPNGGWRKKGVAKKLKAEGVKEGYPDYLLDVARQGYHGLRIELKKTGGATRAGQLSKEQAAWIKALREQGYRAEKATGWVEAWAIICDYLGIKPLEII